MNSYNMFYRYHVPRQWLKASGNILVLFEEMGGDPTQLSFATRQTGSLCSHVSESHPLPIEMWTTKNEEREKTGPTMLLECPSPNQVISSIKFASFGTPRGTCGSFSHGRCNSNKALATVQKVFPGSNLVLFQNFNPISHFSFSFIDFGNAHTGLHGVKKMQHWSLSQYIWRPMCRHYKKFSCRSFLYIIAHSAVSILILGHKQKH